METGLHRERTKEQEPLHGCCCRQGLPVVSTRGEHPTKAGVAAGERAKHNQREPKGVQRARGSRPVVVSPMMEICCACASHWPAKDLNSRTTSFQLIYIEIDPMWQVASDIVLDIIGLEE